ncbi:MAG TPA: pyrroline-5-carboxylate reductase [bacterium]|nr:pyrroline-5-carboxylate reductase [bacterium]
MNAPPPFTAPSGPPARLAILGGGNLGQALARGFAADGRLSPGDIRITRRDADKLAPLTAEGFATGTGNAEAVRAADVIVIAVQPQQMERLVEDVRDAIDPGRHRVISTVSGVSLAQLREVLQSEVPVVRAMPNTAVAVRESMTCLCAGPDAGEALAEATTLFDGVGRTLVIREELMIPATALCACGIAFFLRSVRAASQGGIEIGFHPEEALLLAAATARGAAQLVLREGRHPESEIDRVTTPRGCTIAGLNEMEHQGYSSAFIKGILTSARQAAGLYD